jgi:hypothetical protein
MSDQSLWFSKGKAGQRAFDAAWEKTSEAGLEARFAIQADGPSKRNT